MKKIQEILKGKKGNLLVGIYVLFNGYYVLGIFTGFGSNTWMSIIFAPLLILKNLPTVCQNLLGFIIPISLAYYSYYIIKNKFKGVKYLAWILLIFYLILFLAYVLIFLAFNNFQMHGYSIN